MNEYDYITSKGFEKVEMFGDFSRKLEKKIIL